MDNANNTPSQPAQENIPNAQPNANTQANFNNRPGATAPTVIHVRDRLFHALFYRLAIMYARSFTKPLRRYIEFFTLLMVITFAYS
jgi:hypothetical protein